MAKETKLKEIKPEDLRKEIKGQGNGTSLAKYSPNYKQCFLQHYSWL
jgi:hypothetical protein